MAAINADISIAMREATIVTAQDSAILTKFPTARDSLKEPAAGYFDSAADAATSITTRFALLGAVRRRFKVVAQDLIIPSLASGLPCYRLTDSEQAVDAVHLAARLEVDFEDEKTGMELFG